MGWDSANHRAGSEGLACLGGSRHSHALFTAWVVIPPGRERDQGTTTRVDAAFGTFRDGGSNPPGSTCSTEGSFHETAPVRTDTKRPAGIRRWVSSRSSSRPDVDRMRSQPPCTGPGDPPRRFRTSAPGRSDPHLYDRRVPVASRLVTPTSSCHSRLLARTGAER